MIWQLGGMEDRVWKNVRDVFVTVTVVLLICALCYGGCYILLGLQNG